MAFSVTDFKSNAIQRGGYRPTLFEVDVTYAGAQFSFLCAATATPAYTMGVIEVPYFGRKIKIAGDRTYAEWTTTLMLEENDDVRSNLEEWSMNINAGDTNVRLLVNEEYKQNATVKLFDKQGNVFRRYSLEGCWPTDVGVINLDWNTTDTIATYEVTWAFDFMNEGF